MLNATFEQPGDLVFKHTQSIPRLLKPPSTYQELYPKLWRALGYANERRPIVIGIDGRDG